MINPIENLLNFTPDIYGKKELKPLISQIASVARHLWERGWAERNAGNFSVNISGFFNPGELEKLTGWPFYPCSSRYPALAGNLFLVSGSGTRMRDMAQNPSGNICFLYIAEEGNTFHLAHAGTDGKVLTPTSEISTHLAVHHQLAKTNSPLNTLLHAHVTELIALTHLPGFSSAEPINRMLASMHPEITMFLPGGTGFVPYTRSATESIAAATLAAIEGRQAVVWEKHGCMSLGTSPDDAFDVLDLMAKAARIWFLAASSGNLPRGLSPADIRDLK